MGGLEAVRQAVAFVCDIDVAELSAATSFDDIDADSLVRVAVADLVEEQLGALADGWRIDDTTLGRAQTLGELAADIELLQRAAARRAESVPS